MPMFACFERINMSKRKASQQLSLLDMFQKRSKSGPCPEANHVTASGASTGEQNSAPQPQHVPCPKDTHVTASGASTMEESSASQPQQSPALSKDPDDPSPLPESEPSSSANEHKESPSTGDLPSSSRASIEARCSFPCCGDRQQDKPYQPEDENILNILPKQVHLGKTRRFRPEWYSHFPWISVCVAKKAILCYFCVFATLCQLLPNQKVPSSFATTGFQNWRKATEKLQEHDKSEMHASAMLAVRHLMQKDTIAKSPGDQNEAVKKERRSMLLKELSSPRLLLRQGLSVRGHEEIEGNLRQLMLLRAEETGDSMTAWVNSGKYMSHDVVNELITCIGQATLRKIIPNVQSVGKYALLVDETRDVSNKEQLTLILRWVDNEFVVHEDFIGFMNVDKVDAESLTHAIKDVLLRCMLPLSSCRGQGYDGASAMMGKFTGVAARIRREVPSAVAVHCLAHCLDLCLQDAVRRVRLARQPLDAAREIIKVITSSPKRGALFEMFKAESCPGGGGLRPLCPTRWTVRNVSIGALLRNYQPAYETVSHVNEDFAGDNSSRAGGVMELMKQFVTYFGLKVLHLIFGGLEQVSRTLQSKDLNIQEGRRSINLGRAYLARMRKEEVFSDLYEKALTEADDLGFVEEPRLPRVKKTPRKLDPNSETAHTDDGPKDLYRRQFYEVIDTIDGQMAKRFSDDTFLLPEVMEKLLLRSVNGEGDGSDIPEEIRRVYQDDLNYERLTIQLKMLPDLITELRNEGELPGLKNISSVRSLADIMKQAGGTVMFSEVLVLIKLFLTIPVTTASAERSFSALRRLKTYLRSTMTQNRLNNAALPHVHKAYADSLNLHEIARNFITANDRRIHFFGKI